MNFKKTDLAIASEVAALLSIKATIQHFDENGADQHAAIDAQIAVLSERLDLDTVHDQYAEDSTRNPAAFCPLTFDSALQACNWMSGRLNRQFDEAPSARWIEVAL